MKRFILIIGLIWSVISCHAQILTKAKWDIRLIDSESMEKEIVFTAKMDKGWHLYDMNLPEGGPISTSFTFDLKQGVELIGNPTPSTKPTKVYDETFDMELRWYSGTVSFTQRIRVIDPLKFKLKGEVQFMVCNDETCLPPERIDFSFDKKNISKTIINNKVEPNEPMIADETLPQDVENTQSDSLVDPEDSFQDTQSTNSKKIEGITFDHELWNPVIDDLRAYGDDMVSTSDVSWIYIFFAGFVGGFIALLTPCVWPMIPMTVSFFLKRSKNRKKAISDALLYGFSIIVIYVVMGLLITGAFGASALNDLSTNAIFNVVFFLLLVLFAISFFGAFELVLPASWTNKMDSKADSATGVLSIFFMAFTLVLVSFSCTGPIIGTLLVQAASEGVAIGPAIGMSGFAIALAIPFALFAIFPNLLQNVPKSGGWLNSVKVVLGFLELALALKFLSVADLAYGWRILDREVFLVLWIVIFMLLGGYLLGKIHFIHDSKIDYISVPRLFMAIVSLAFAVYMIPGLWGAPLKAISAFAPPLHTQDFNLYKDNDPLIFDDYERGMAHAKEMNKPVLIDFSGHGCVNCRKMEASVLTDPEVKELLNQHFILITLMVDDKSKLDKPIEIEEADKKRTLKTVGDKWSYLQRYKFGANAQPFYVILNNDGAPLSPSYAFNENPAKFLDFLQKGFKNYKP